MSAHLLSADRDGAVKRCRCRRRFVSGGPRPGFSLVGLLVTMVLIVVLASVLLTSLNKAMTGAGNTTPASVASVNDQLVLQQLSQSLLADATGSGTGGMLVPSRLARSEEWSLNTSAAFWSAMIMEGLTSPRQLISRNERNPFVDVDSDYDFRAYDAHGLPWDPSFAADLQQGSNVSFAHMPLFGERYDARWATVSLDSRFPLMGNRGPQDGVVTASSYTTGRDGGWAGNVVFGDGHVEWTNTTSLGSLTVERGGVMLDDNLYRMDDGADGRDAILAFTRLMTDAGPELQWD